MREEILEDLWAIVRSIPYGKAMSYGEVGKCLKYPATGRMVGRWIRQSPPDIPWWRVVNKRGEFPVGKISPEHAFEQEELLKEEGLKIENGRVSPAALLSSEDL